MRRAAGYRGAAMARTLVTSVLWALVAAIVAVTALRLTGREGGWPLIAVMSFVPYIAVGALLTGLVALWLRRGMAGVVALACCAALVLAVVLDEASKGSRVLKILYFLPLLMSSVALGVVFKNIYDPNFGPINAFLSAVHLDGLVRDWLGDPRYALGSVIAVVCWQNIPFYMVLFLAGLSSFPRELGEAARLDGASESTIFWRIKLPHLQGTVRTGAMLAIVGSLRYFDLIFIMTDGGPEGASELMATYMFRTVFSSFQLGYGSTIASAMFIIVTIVASLAMRATRRYETEV